MFNIKFDFSLDKLEITYTCSDEIKTFLEEHDYFDCGEVGEFTIKRIDGKNYKHNFVVIANDTIIGDLFFGSYNVHRPFIYLSLRNHCLYDKDLLSSITYLEQSLNLEFMRISKLHIAFDSNINLINKFYKLIRNKDVDWVINDRKIKDRNEFIDSLLHMSSGSLNNIRKNKSFSIKNSEGDLELNAYNKKLELNKSHKDYITDKLGFYKHVYRFEVRMNCAKIIKETLATAGVTNESLYINLFNEEILMRLFNIALSRVVRVQIKRKPCSLLEVLI